MSTKGLAVALFTIFFSLTLSSALALEPQCPTYTHHVNPGFNYKDIIKFGGIDLDLKKAGVQETLSVAPGMKVAAQAKWSFGTACPDCKFYVNVYGSWDPTNEIAQLYSGTMGSLESSYSPSFFPISPVTEGEYIVRVIFVMKEGYAADFQASNQRKLSCKGERHVFFMDGRLKVSGELLGVEIHSPSPKSAAGVAERTLGDTVVINASVYGNISSITVFVDGKNVSKELPYYWDTANESKGIHLVAVEVTGNNTRQREEVRVELSGATATGEVPAVEWAKEFGTGFHDAELSADGRWIFLVGNDDTYLYTQTGVLEWRKSNNKGFKKIAISRDGSTLAAASGKTFFYLSPEGAVLWNTTLAQQASDIAIAPSGKSVVAAGKELLYFDVDGSKLWNVTLKEDIVSVSVSSEESIALASSSRVYLFSNTSTNLWNYPAPGKVRAVASINEGIVVAGAGEDVLYISEGILRRSLPAQGQVVDVASSPDGNSVIVGLENSVRFYNNGTLLWSFETENPLREVFISEDAATLVYTEDNRIAFAYTGVKERVSGERIIGLPVIIAVLVVVAAVLGALRFQKKKQAEKESAAANQREASIEIEHVSEGLKILSEGSLLVQVLNSKTKRPVIRATVSLNSRSKETGENGQALFDDVTRGRYRLRVRRKFYKPLQLEHVFKGPEEQIRLMLTPVFGIAEEHEIRLKTALEEVKRSQRAVSHLDSCLPTYFRSIAENTVDFVVASSDISVDFKGFDYEDFMEGFVSITENICRDLVEIILDWRNVKLYEIGGTQEGECLSGSFGDREKLEQAVPNPRKFIETFLPVVRRKLSLIDSKITDRIGELTITPLSGVWKMAEKLINQAQKLDDEGKDAAQLMAVINLLFADSLLNIVEEMLGREDILDRLSHGII